MGNPTRFPNGISTVQANRAGADLGFPSPVKWHIWVNDFDLPSTITATDWTITDTGAAASAIQDEIGGVLKITNAAADNDRRFYQGIKETFKIVSGKKTYFETRMKASDAIQSDILMGLSITDTTPLDATDIIGFQKDDGDANVDINVTKNSTTTTAVATTLVADTYVKLAVMYNGIDKVHYFVDDIKKGSLAITNLPDDEELCVSFGIQNGEAAAKNMSIDYILVAQER